MIQKEEMIRTLIQWASICSGSHYLAGLKTMAEVLLAAFAPLSDEFERIPIDSSGKELLLFRKKRPGCRSVLLGGHYDTVFGENSSFQQVKQIDDTLNGPGVIDMKGGLVVLLYALRAFESSPEKANLSWEVFLNPDEEIGSIDSAPYLEKLAKQHDYGLLFEPADPNGSYIARRKASWSFKITAQGRSAHAGRDFFEGVNAIMILNNCLTQIHQWNTPEITINIGTIQGGEALNIVPDWAVATLNVRAWSLNDINKIKEKIADIIKLYPSELKNWNLGSAKASGFDLSKPAQYYNIGPVSKVKSRELSLEPKSNSSAHLGINRKLTIETLSYRPPKTLDQNTEKLYLAIKDAAEEEGVVFQTEDSGGCSDGNNLSFAGLPTIDTMGPIGGHMHRSDEYIEIASLIERTNIAIRLLRKLQ